MNRLAASASLLLGTLAHVSLNCLSTGLSLETLLTIATGVSGSIAGDMLKNLSKDKLKHLLFGTHPNDLNHSIQKLFLASLGEALDNILVLYAETGISRQEKAQAKKAIAEIKKRIQAKGTPLVVEALKQDDSISQFIRSGYGDDKVSLYLKEMLGQASLDAKLSQFIAQHFPAQIQLCFGEGLKSPTHRDAWVAYQRLMSDELRTLVVGIAQGQEEMRQDLKDLKLASGLDGSTLEGLHRLNELLSDDSKFALALNEALGQSLSQLEELANRIIHITTETHYTVLEIKALQQEQLRRARRLQYLVALALLFGLLSVGVVARMWLLRPFNLSVVVYGWLGKEHTPLRGTGSLTLMVGGKAYEGEIDSRGRVLFADMPHDSKGQTARVALRDTEGMPYYCCDSTLVIEQGQTLYLPISLLGIDRAVGVVKDEESQAPIPNARVQIAGLEGQTDSLGRFDLSIPAPQQAEEQEIEIIKEGYRGYRATHTMVGKETFRIFLTRD